MVVLSEIGRLGFDNSSERPKTPAPSDIQSIFDKALLAQSFVDNDRKYLLAGRYLFFPLKDPTNNEPLGFAGVLLKESFINDELIAGSINKALVRYHAHTDSPAVAITISDQQNPRTLLKRADSNRVLSRNQLRSSVLELDGGNRAKEYKSDSKPGEHH